MLIALVSANAGTSVSTQIRRVLLIDDERPAREDLRRLLAVHPHLEVVAEAGHMADAEALLRASQYDLVFLDVILRGGNGFDLVPAVRPGAALVFVTGYEKYAVRAFEANALDYLVKPVSPDRLAEAVKKQESLDSGAPRQEPTVRFTLSDRVYLKTDADTAVFVRIEDIIAILSSENYTEVFVRGGRRFLVRRTMKVWEDLLPAERFSRVHRTALVSTDKVVSATHEGRETTLLTLDQLATPVKARRDLWEALAKRLERSA